MGLYRIKEGLRRAKSLIEKGDENSLRYACLELRFCMEKVVYRQLQEYKDKVPGSVVGVWNPERLVRLLGSFDPTSKVDGEVSYSLQQTPDQIPTTWEKLGNTRAIPWEEFRKSYSKLGSYLHEQAPKISGKKTKPLTAQSLESIYSRLEVISQADAIFAMCDVIHAKCDCGEVLYVGRQEFETDELVVCSNTKCNKLYRKIIDEFGEKKLTLADTLWIKCLDCEANISRSLSEVWRRIVCPECTATYKISLSHTKIEKL